MNVNNSYADVLIGLQFGDESKGKCAATIVKKGNYNYVFKSNGGSNAGHSIYINGTKLVTSLIPCGVLFGITSVIGMGCVVNIEKLYKEIENLEQHGFSVRDYLRIDKRAHIVTSQHLFEDSQDDTIGTTKQGISPAYRDKYARKGFRAEDCKAAIGDFLFDTYDLYHQNDVRILFEGSQGHLLDIDHGIYPYVTSSHTSTAGALLNGIPPQMVRCVYGIAKAYTTYVGLRQFELPGQEIFDRIRILGNEFGSITGRPRQIGWLDLDMLIQAARINGVTHLIINKIDVLEEAGQFTMIESGQRLDFYNMPDFERYLDLRMKDSCPYLQKIHFSRSPLDI